MCWVTLALNLCVEAVTFAFCALGLVLIITVILLGLQMLMPGLSPYYAEPHAGITTGSGARTNTKSRSNPFQSYL